MPVMSVASYGRTNRQSGLLPYKCRAVEFFIFCLGGIFVSGGSVE